MKFLTQDNTSVICIRKETAVVTLAQEIAALTEQAAELQGESPVQVIWQTGKFYEKEMKEHLAKYPNKEVWQGAFIERMDYAYEAADLVISRSGACTVSELCLVGKPTLFVPSPNVAEDHQTKNAMALVEKGAAAMVKDSEAVERAMEEALLLVGDRERLSRLSENIEKLAIGDSAERIVRELKKIW